MTMKKDRIFPLLFVGLFILPRMVLAQVDPTLAGMILVYTDKAKKQYETQIGMMNSETAGHVWLEQEVRNTTNFQKQFDTYLSEFRGIIAYAAQIYGFYHEISLLTDNMSKLIKQIGETPANAVAIALHRKRNDIYVSIINSSVGIVNTIRQVCVDSKMTEKQRVELVFSIRPQLQSMNRQLAMLTKLVKHTTLAQVWYQIEYGSVPHSEGKAGIIEDCLSQWRMNGRNVKPKH